MGIDGGAFKEDKEEGHMIVQDLGELRGDFLIFGGPYSNAQASTALIDAARAHGIVPENCICTGDVVAYCADPVATLALIRGFGGPVVAGNCERQLAQDAPDCGCGFEQGRACDLLSLGWYGYADARVGAPDRAWMAALPDLITFAHQARRYAVIHGGARDISRFLWPVSPAEVFAQEIAVIEQAVGPVDVVLAGHCGLAFARDIGRHRWINAGVIGMPPHDGRAQTRYAVISGQGVVFHRLGYDVDGAAAAMEAVGLTQGYHTALRRGIWPSEDVLPAGMRRAVEA